MTLGIIVAETWIRWGSWREHRTGDGSKRRL